MSTTQTEYADMRKMVELVRTVINETVAANPMPPELKAVQAQHRPDEPVSYDTAVRMIQWMTDVCLFYRSGLDSLLQIGQTLIAKHDKLN